ncbi:MAG: hypothetical protein PUD22_05640 [Erysipelotrichaceae bacterium]|nr:hypothetical protein [Erysipelotrichaceae bacterium]
MAKVELGYNPYLLETKVTFNGNEPRINSLIEKYRSSSLYEWINKMPTILHDEMNGFDFELDFSGTEKDFIRIKDVFSNIDDVEIFHKNSLKGRNEKNESIEQMMTWLKNHPNRQFDYDAFRNDNRELFDSPYPFLILNGGRIDETMFEGLNVSADSIDNLNSINDADITNVPVLICIDNESIVSLEKNVRALMGRGDLIQAQLFFLIHPSINKRRTIRLLNDLGIKEPQIVNDGDVSSIKNYMEIYPITNFIRETIKLMNKSYVEMKNALDVSLKENEASSKETRDRIEELDKGIEALKLVIDNLNNRDNINIPSRCHEKQYDLKQRIRNWRKRKTKITSDDEAKQYAREFENDAVSYILQFTKEIDSIFELERIVLEKRYLELYKAAGFDQQYIPNVSQQSIIADNEEVSISYELLKMKHERYVEQRDTFALFATPVNCELIREVTYYNKEWKDYIEELLMPKAEAYITKRQGVFLDYETAFAEDLISHLNELLNGEIDKKNGVVAEMSETDQELQNDADWLSELYDIIDAIMRG